MNGESTINSRYDYEVRITDCIRTKKWAEAVQLSEAQRDRAVGEAIKPGVNAALRVALLAAWFQANNEARAIITPVENGELDEVIVQDALWLHLGSSVAYAHVLLPHHAIEPPLLTAFALAVRRKVFDVVEREHPKILAEPFDKALKEFHHPPLPPFTWD